MNHCFRFAFFAFQNRIRKASEIEMVFFRNGFKLFSYTLICQEGFHLKHFSLVYTTVHNTAAIDKNLAFLLHIFDLVVNQQPHKCNMIFFINSTYLNILNFLHLMNGQLVCKQKSWKNLTEVFVSKYAKYIVALLTTRFFQNLELGTFKFQLMFLLIDCRFTNKQNCYLFTGVWVRS